MRAGVAERRSASAPTNALPLEHIREDLGDCSPVTAYSGVKPLENHMFVERLSTRISIASHQ
jgi:hypothetical protein